MSTIYKFKVDDYLIDVTINSHYENLTVTYEDTEEKVLEIHNTLSFKIFDRYKSFHTLQILANIEFKKILDKEYCKDLKATLIEGLLEKSEELKKIADSYKAFNI